MEKGRIVTSQNYVLEVGQKFIPKRLEEYRMHTVTIVAERDGINDKGLRTRDICEWY